MDFEHGRTYKVQCHKCGFSIDYDEYAVPIYLSLGQSYKPDEQVFCVPCFKKFVLEEVGENS